VRDFVYNEDEVNAGKNELTKLASDKKKQFVSWWLILYGCYCSKYWLIMYYMSHPRRHSDLLLPISTSSQYILVADIVNCYLQTIPWLLSESQPVCNEWFLWSDISAKVLI